MRSRIFGLLARSATRSARWIVLLVGLALVAPGSALASEELERVQGELYRLSGELELLREHLGKPLNQQPPLLVRNAGPREIYHQAQTTFAKADRLAFELTATRVALPKPPTQSVGWSDVTELVSRTLTRIEAIKQELSIEEVVSVSPPPGVPSPGDLFALTVQSNRQLNLMLWEPYSPTEVYQRVGDVLQGARSLLERVPGAVEPSRPAREPKRQPADVYRVLMDCFRRAQQLRGLTQRVELSPGSADSIVPSDVYDLATLLLAELGTLRELAGATDPLPPSYYPGRKLPSDVHQLSRWVESYLRELERAGGIGRGAKRAGSGEV